MPQPNPQNSPLETLSEIRDLMSRSTRFLSLSGLSGVWAGLCALIGAAVAWAWLGMSPFEGSETFYYQKALETERWGLTYRPFFLGLGSVVLLAALAGGWFFTNRKAQKSGQSLFDAASKRMAFALLVPLVSGGIFCLALVFWNIHGLVAPATLLFYGIALVSASRETFRDVQFLGFFEIALGLFGCFFIGFGLELWAVGFGILHIGYGLMMHSRYK